MEKNQNPLTSYTPKSKLPYYFDRRYCRPKVKRAPWLFKINPRSLENLCIEEVNKLPKPNSWEWSIEDVGHWIEQTVGYPQYRDCFEKNFITGRKLILVDESTLPQWNITNFEHIKKIMKDLRKLLHIEPESYARSITLPSRDPQAMFLIHKWPTGVIRERITRTDILQKVGYLIKDRPKPPLNMWDRTNYEKPKFPKEMVGLWRMRTNRQLTGCSNYFYDM